MSETPFSVFGYNTCSSKCEKLAHLILGTVRTTPDPYTTEEYLKAQQSDALKCLHMKESQIAVMSVRLQVKSNT